MNLIQRIIKNILILILLVFSGHTISAQGYVVEDGTATFKAKISINSFTGETDQLQGQINFETGEFEFSIPVESIRTGNKKRDLHMNELLNSEVNPNVAFKGKLIDEFDSNKTEKQFIDAKGDFTLAGFSKEVTITIELVLEKNGLRLTANWSLLITDYGLERPKKAFLKVDDKQELSVNAFLIKE